MKTLGELAETIAKIAVPAAVLGYMALRAHLNRIGIPATETLGLERYLAETFLLVTALLAPTVIAVALIALVVVVRRWLLDRSKRGGGGRLQRLEWLGRNRPALLLFILAVAYVLLVRRLTLTWPDQDVAVGQLVQSRIESPSGWWTLMWLVFVCISAAVVIRESDAATGERVRARTPLAMRLATIMLIVLVLHVPLVYGWTVRRASYPAVSIELKDPDERACGLLVIETSEDLRIWKAEKNRGIVLRIPRSRVIRIVAGAVEDLATTAGLVASGTRESAPDCP